MQDKHKTEHSQKTPVIPRVFTSSNSDGKLRTYCHECKPDEYTLVFGFDENKRPVVKCLHCGSTMATPLFFTFANFDGEFRSFCHICKIDEPALVIGVDENKQPAIKCLRCGFTLTSSKIELKNLYPAFVKNTRLLGQALREMVKKTLAHVESPPARPKTKLMPTVVPVVKPETPTAKPTLNVAPEVPSAESPLLPKPPEAKPIPAPPKSEPEPTVPEPELVQKIVRLVLSYLEDSWSCKKIPGEPFRRHVAKISGRYENAVWESLFPAHVVKLRTTDFFILRDDKHRPKGFEGLIDDKGVLPCDEPALF